VREKERTEIRIELGSGTSQVGGAGRERTTEGEDGRGKKEEKRRNHLAVDEEIGIHG
jgi:hypothetical protein